jgi:hypothetical protein
MCIRRGAKEIKINSKMKVSHAGVGIESFECIIVQWRENE